MLDLTPQQILFVVCVGLFTAIAAVCDFRTRRIPNRLTMPMLAAGCIYQVAFAGWSGLADAGLAFCIGFGTLFVLWMVGGGGGGDVKLMGALSVWLGVRMTLLVMVASTLFVMLGTLAVLLLNLFQTGPWKTKTKFFARPLPAKKDDEKPVAETAEQRQKRRVMAFAVPVAVATWLVMVWRLPLI